MRETDLATLKGKSISNPYKDVSFHAMLLILAVNIQKSLHTYLPANALAYSYVQLLWF